MSDTPVTAETVPPDDKKECRECCARMPKQANICTNCKSFYDWRRHFQLVTTVILALLTALCSVLNTAVPQVIKLLDYHSNTSFTVTTADEKVIYLYVVNSGLKPAQLRGYQLRFGELPIENAWLELIDDDKSEGKSLIPPGSTKIGLFVSGLKPRLRKPPQPERFTTKEIESMLSGHTVTLEIEIQESSDPKEGPWPIRTETFRAELIRELISNRLVESSARPF